MIFNAFLHTILGNSPHFRMCLIFPGAFTYTLQATGTRLGVLFESFIGILLAVLIAFIYSWLVTFLLFAMIPVIFVAGILTVKGISALNEKSKKAAEMAGKVRELLKTKVLSNAVVSIYVS